MKGTPTQCNAMQIGCGFTSSHRKRIAAIMTESKGTGWKSIPISQRSKPIGFRFYRKMPASEDAAAGKVLTLRCWGEIRLKGHSGFCGLRLCGGPSALQIGRAAFAFFGLVVLLAHKALLSKNILVV